VTEGIFSLCTGI